MANLDLYTVVEFPITINIEPRMMHKGLYTDIEDNVKQIYEGRCKPNIGYIKKGSIQIVNKTLGKSEGSHLTGNMTYRLQVRCLAAMPVKGQKLS